MVIAVDVRRDRTEGRDVVRGIESNTARARACLKQGVKARERESNNVESPLNKIQKFLIQLLVVLKTECRCRRHMHPADTVPVRLLQY